jgi:vitamin B12 transporter
MRKKVLVLIGTLVLLTVNYVWAEEKKETNTYDLGKIIITATKTEVYQAQTGSSSTVITAEDIKKTDKRTVSEVLRNVPGVAVAQNGAFGGLTSVYLRGAKPGHTLVLIDGVEVNDPMSTDRSFDFAHLTTDNIERIEVVRGSQSTLYGSDAIGGVINIITKKGKGKPKFSISSEGGSYKTSRENIGLSGSTEKLNYSIFASRLDSDGISKAADGAEKDGYENTAISSKIGYKIFDNSELSLVTHFTDSQTDLDDGSYEDDPNYTAWNRNLVLKLEFNQTMKPWWNHKLSFSYSDTRRKYRDEKDTVDTSEDMQSWYKGDNKKFEWQNNFSPVNWDTLTGGFEYEEERGSSFSRDVLWGDSRFDRKTVDNKGYYLQNQLKIWETLFITPGLRIDDHKLFGAETTYKISTAYIISQTQTHLKANWGTGFKAPSIYQLYSTENYGGGPIGDPNLKPDKSKSYDFGFEQSLLNNNKLSFGTTYFHNDFKNMVDYDLVASKYKNIGQAKTSGFEIESSFRPIESLKITANYTHTDTKDKETGKKLTRRPQNQTGLDINWALFEKANLNLKTTYVGHTWNNSANTQKVKPYTKVDLSTSYDLTKNFQIFGRIENFFDRKYAESRGYATPGRSFYAGFKSKF